MATLRLTPAPPPPGHQVEVRRQMLLAKTSSMSCPACRGKDITLQTPAIIPAPWRCRSCGTKWQEDP